MVRCKNTSEVAHRFRAVLPDCHIWQILKCWHNSATTATGHRRRGLGMGQKITQLRRAEGPQPGR